MSSNKIVRKKQRSHLLAAAIKKKCLEIEYLNELAASKSSLNVLGMHGAYSSSDEDSDYIPQLNYDSEVNSTNSGSKVIHPPKNFELSGEDLYESNSSMETDTPLIDTNENFKRNLAVWCTDHSITRVAMNDLLKVFGPDLPKDTRTFEIKECKRKKALPSPVTVQASQSIGPVLYLNEDGFVIADQPTNSLTEPVRHSSSNTSTMPQIIPRRDSLKENHSVCISESNINELQYTSPKNPIGSCSFPVPEYRHRTPGSSKPLTQYRNRTPGSSKPLTPMEKKMLLWMEKVNFKLEEHSSILTKILNSCSTSSEDPSDSDFPDLPIKNDKDMLLWEEYLSTATNFSKAVKCLSIKGGSEESTITRRVLKSVLSTELACCYNWAGRGEKRPFKELVTKRLVICAVRENKNAKTASEKDIEDSIKNWLKYCPLRLQYSRKK